MNANTPSSEERAEKLQGMGCKRKRVEDIRFTQGKGNYVDDLKLPGMLYGDFVRSPHAHARIKRIDVSKATQGAGRARRPDRRRAEAALAPLHANPRGRRASSVGGREGALSEPRSRLRDRTTAMRRRTRSSLSRSNTRRCRSLSIRSRRWIRMRRCCARTSRTRRMAFTAGAGIITTSSPGKLATRRQPRPPSPVPRRPSRS